MKFDVYVVGKDGNIIIKSPVRYEEQPEKISLQYYNNTTTTVDLSIGLTENTGFSLVFDVDEDFKGLSLSPNSKDIFVEIGQEIDYNKQGTLVLYVNDTTLGTHHKFHIECYKNIADFNRVDKNDYIQLVRTYFGTLRESTSIIDPVITIQQTGTIDFNYVHIPVFNRWYYVADITSIATDLWEITLTIDVLMTYRHGLKAQKAFIDRNETYYESKADMIDKKRIIYPGVNVETVELENELFVELQDTYMIEPFTDRRFGGSLTYILSGYKIETNEILHGYVNGGI